MRWEGLSGARSCVTGRVERPFDVTLARVFFLSHRGRSVLDPSPVESPEARPLLGRRTPAPLVVVAELGNPQRTC